MSPYRITLMLFIDMVFDELTGNAAQGILSIGKYSLSLQIPFTLFCKGNLADLGRKLHLSLAKGNPK
jgi:hypothetical protein